jgi:hypothetical protein
MLFVPLIAVCKWRVITTRMVYSRNVEESGRAGQPFIVSKIVPNEKIIGGVQIYTGKMICTCICANHSGIKIKVLCK